MKKPDRSFYPPGPSYPTGPGDTPFYYHPIQRPPVGDLAIVYRTAPFLVHRIYLSSALAEQWKKGGSENSCTPSTCPESIRIARSILDYLQGDPAAPGPVPWHLLYLKDLSPLQVQVLRETSHIPYGGTASYKAIAEAIDRPRAYRFVGTALAVNPFPILIPCHRVIRSDGSPGEFGGGENLKKWLIDMESRNKKREHPTFNIQHPTSN